MALLMLPQLYAQKPGYLGRRTLVKVNLLNGYRPGFNQVDVEYVLGRLFTVEGSFQLISQSMGSYEVERRTGTIAPFGGTREAVEYSTLKGGVTSGWCAGVSGRLYFNRVIPAPYGWYLSLQLGFGKVTFEDFEVHYRYEDKFAVSGVYNQKYVLPPKKLTGESTFIRTELPGFGYQRIFKKRFFYDAKLSLLVQYAGIPEDMLNAFEYNYYLRSGMYSIGISKVSFGPAFDLRVGMLLF